MIEKYSNANFIKGFIRYSLVEDVVSSSDWVEVENRLKKYDKDGYKEKTRRLFNELKFYNCVLGIDYLITDTLNKFFVEKFKIRDWSKLEKRFIEKIKSNRKTKTLMEAESILHNEIDGDKKNMLSPDIMLYVAGFGLGEFIEYIRGYTKKFEKKDNLLEMLKKFNDCRKIVVHNLCNGREDINKKIEDSFILYKEINDLVNEIIGCEKELYGLTEEERGIVEGEINL